MVLRSVHLKVPSGIGNEGDVAMGNGYRIATGNHLYRNLTMGPGTIYVAQWAYIWVIGKFRMEPGTAYVVEALDWPNNSANGAGGGSQTYAGGGGGGGGGGAGHASAGAAGAAGQGTDLDGLYSVGGGGGGGAYYNPDSWGINQGADGYLQWGSKGGAGGTGLGIPFDLGDGAHGDVTCYNGMVLSHGDVWRARRWYVPGGVTVWVNGYVQIKCRERYWVEGSMNGAARGWGGVAADKNNHAGGRGNDGSPRATVPVNHGGYGGHDRWAGRSSGAGGGGGSSWGTGGNGGWGYGDSSADIACDPGQAHGTFWDPGSTGGGGSGGTGGGGESFDNVRCIGGSSATGGSALLVQAPALHGSGSHVFDGGSGGQGEGYIGREGAGAGAGGSAGGCMLHKAGMEWIAWYNYARGGTGGRGISGGGSNPTYSAAGRRGGGGVIGLQVAATNAGMQVADVAGGAPGPHDNPGDYNLDGGYGGAGNWSRAAYDKNTYAVGGGAGGWAGGIMRIACLHNGFHWDGYAVVDGGPGAAGGVWTHGSGGGGGGGSGGLFWLLAPKGTGTGSGYTRGGAGGAGGDNGSGFRNGGAGGTGAGGWMRFDWAAGGPSFSTLQAGDYAINKKMAVIQQCVC